MAVPVASVVFVLMLVLLAPLRMALGWLGADAAGLSAQRVEGTVWSGRLHAADFRGLPLGDARVGLDPVGFRLRVAAVGEVRGRAAVKLSGRGLSLSGADAVLPLERLAPGLPLRGDLVLEDLRVDFRGAACRSAGGKITVQAARLAVLGQTASGLRLSGSAACRNGRLVAPLSGQAAGVALDAVLQVDGAGRYEVTTRLRATDPLAAAAAAAAGFERDLDGFTRTDRGVLGAGR